MATVDVPRPGPGQVLVRVAGNGLCHSDIGMAQMPASVGELVGWAMPFTLGHEIGGYVEEIGEGAVDTYGRRSRSAQAVALVSPSLVRAVPLLPARARQRLPQRSGRARLRARRRPRAVRRRRRGPLGAAADDRSIPSLPRRLTDAGSTSYHAVKRALHLLEPGSTAVVLGAGGLGSFADPVHPRAVAGQGDRRRPAPGAGWITPASSVPARRSPASTARPPGRVRELTAGEGAELVLDFVGIDSTIAAGLASVRSGGAFALVGAAGGIFKGPWMGGLPKDADIFTFQGSCISDAQAVMTLAEQGLIRSDVDVFPLDRVAEAYEALDTGELRGRAVVTPT